MRKVLRIGCRHCPAQDQAGLRGMKEPELNHQEDPAQRPGPARAHEVLPNLPLPPAAPRDPVVAINPDYEGRTFEPSEPYEVSRVKIAEFASAIGEPSPLCRDRAAAQAAGSPDLTAPPTFAIPVTSGG